MHLSKHFLVCLIITRTDSSVCKYRCTKKHPTWRTVWVVDFERRTDTPVNIKSQDSGWSSGPGYGSLPFPWEGALVILLVPFQRSGNCQRALQKVLELALSAWLNFIVVAINQTNLSLKRTLVQYIRVPLLQSTTTKQRPRSYFETGGRVQ